MVKNHLTFVSDYGDIRMGFHSGVWYSCYGTAISLLENTLALDTLASVNYQPNLLNKIITSLNGWSWNIKYFHYYFHKIYTCSKLSCDDDRSDVKVRVVFRFLSWSISRIKLSYLFDNFVSGSWWDDQDSNGSFAKNKRILGQLSLTTELWRGNTTAALAKFENPGNMTVERLA